ncbi:MAG TPA: extracellular solute-binding protein, partial [Chloroflexota bacterium]|nr:extracellular solute-binding protein [Chloroflexota bacterium]
MSQGGTGIVEGLTAGFKSKYPEVQVESTVGNGGEIATKLLTQRQAGRFEVDVVVHGTTTMIADLMPAGAIEPIGPFLVGPNDSDPAKWTGGRFEFADEAGKYDLIFTGAVKVPFMYNPNAVSPGEFKTYKDLLQPKWRGKLAMIDPRDAGPGLATATFFYTIPSLGKDYLKQLFGQGVVLTRDFRQLADWVARAQYPIGLGASDTAAFELKQKGVPIEFLSPEALQEGSYLTSGWGSVAVVNRAPHPNAARLYLDWLLSKEGQQSVARAAGYPSRRLDASIDGLPPAMVPKPGVEYQE